MAKSSAPTKAAWNAGKQANTSGKNLFANPYDSVFQLKDWNNWQNGWWYAEFVRSHRRQDVKNRDSHSGSTN